MRRAFTIGLVLLLSASLALPAKKKKKKGEEEEITQVLPVLKDPPPAVATEVQRLSFYVTPLSAKGLLSAQTREALKLVMKAAKGATVVKLRAFVAGSGDQRRVQSLVSELFAEEKMALPALTVVQVGALPLEGSQIVIESTMADNKKALNPNGLALISGQPSKLADPVGPLKAAVGKLGLEGMSVLRVTCYVSNLDAVPEGRTQVAAAFPKAVMNFVQLQRASLDDFAECEGVAALKAAPSGRLELVEATEGRYSQAALVGPGKVALTGMQMAFNNQEADVRLAFERLGKALETVNANYKGTAMTHIYALTNSVSERTRKIRFEFYNAKKPPASTMLLFEGLPSLDATVGIDVWSTLD